MGSDSYPFISLYLTINSKKKYYTTPWILLSSKRHPSWRKSARRNRGKKTESQYTSIKFTKSRGMVDETGKEVWSSNVMAFIKLGNDTNIRNKRLKTSFSHFHKRIMNGILLTSAQCRMLQNMTNTSTILAWGTKCSTKLQKRKTIT